MDPANPAASFQSTIWSLVLGARSDRCSLEPLLRSYWSPVYADIRRQGYGGHDASDLTQEFLTQVVLGRAQPLPLTTLAPLVGAADETRVSRMLQAMKRRFRRTLREVIAETVSDAALVEQELRELREHFGA